MLYKDTIINRKVSDPILVITNLSESVTSFDIEWTEYYGEGQPVTPRNEHIGVGESIEICIKSIESEYLDYDVYIGLNNWSELFALSDDSYNVSLTNGYALNVLDKTKNAYAGIVASTNPNPWG